MICNKKLKKCKNISLFVQNVLHCLIEVKPKGLKFVLFNIDEVL